MTIQGIGIGAGVHGELGYTVLGRTQMACPGGVVVGGDGGGRVDEKELHCAVRQAQLERALTVPACVAGRQRSAKLQAHAAAVQTAPEQTNI